MRRAAIIEEAWNAGGPFVGGNTGSAGSGGWKPHTIVTVQSPWSDVSNGRNVIHPQSIGVGNAMRERGLPVRWYQRSDNSQTEVEIPNVLSVTIDRSIDNDAATCEILIKNTWMYNNGAAPAVEYEIGQHGYFTPDHGDDMTARARWNHQTNSWNGVLGTNALIRTYQGYGGQQKTLQECLDDGNLVLTGVWLVDSLRVTATGDLSLSCRDMMKLLIDQQLFPPLVPADKYPLKYFRYAFENRQVTATSGVFQDGGSTADATPGARTIYYAHSSQDHWYGTNANIHGHRGTDSLDGIDTTYALSVGHSGPDKVFSTVWWEYGVDTGLGPSGMNAVWVHPWAGGYEMYVSVFENGDWQGGQTVPYDHSPLIGRQPHVVDTGADIPYVAKFTVPYEESKYYVLPRVYDATAFRITFRHLYDSGIGPWRYRAGVREVQAHVLQGEGDIATSSLSGQTVPPIFYAADYLHDAENKNKAGYITVSNYGFVDVFGDCREFAPSRVDDETIKALLKDFVDAAGSDAAEVSSVALTPKGDGYWILYSRGIVRSFGAAQYDGEPYGQFNFESGAPFGGINKAATIVSTNTGQGYWVITWAGEIFAYGDAPEYPNAATIPSEFFHGGCAHRGRPGEEEGLYLVATHGAVYTYGAAVYRGGYDKSFGVDNIGQQELAIDIECKLDGKGYWILTTAGHVQAFGESGDFGEIADPAAHQSSFDRYYQLMSTPEGDGFLMLDGDGQIEQFGDVYNRYWGAPVPGTTGQLRYDGNYLDFSDIVRDLALWSGFWLRAVVGTDELPEVYGNIEGTGMFSEEHLPDDMFDKRPVIDTINDLKESVGYLCWVDDEGALRFESPNWWGPGNFLYDGTHVTDVFEIDERIQLTGYSYSTNDNNLRSRVIISSEDPTGGGASTVYTEFIPSSSSELRGLLKPAMWVNGHFQKKLDQQIMAELIALHIWFSRRVGSIECAANPLISINDQVRVYERTTGETYLHYVRGVHSSHNLESGEYVMSIETNWLGSGDAWVVTPDDPTDSTLGYFVLSKIALEWVYNSPSGSVKAGGYEIKDPAT